MTAAEPAKLRFTGAVGVFLVGAVCQYIGYAVAFQNFETLSPMWTAWMRTFLAGLVLTLAVRPWGVRRSRTWYVKATGFGTVVLTMMS